MNSVGNMIQICANLREKIGTWMYFNETLPDGLYIVHRFLSPFALSEIQTSKMENLRSAQFYIFWVEKYRNDP